MGRPAARLPTGLSMSSITAHRNIGNLECGIRNGRHEFQIPNSKFLIAKRSFRTAAAAMCVVVFGAIHMSAQTKYDLLLKGGHVIDAKNNISAVRDVAIAGGKIAAVGANINAADALKVVDASGLYVTPGLVDIHVHVYAGTGDRGSAGRRHNPESGCCPPR